MVPKNHHNVLVRWFLGSLVAWLLGCVVRTTRRNEWTNELRNQGTKSEDRVQAAEGERVRESVFHLRLARLVGYDVQVAGWIRLIVVGCGRQHAAAQRQQRGDGFGLGEAKLGDTELAALVRTRLAACPELADARIDFSVKDGWVWLRGVATADGRKAAEQALGDLQPGVFVVNQLALTAAEKVVAER